MTEEVRAALAIARKDIRHISRYPGNLAALLFMPLSQLVIPVYLFGRTFEVDGRLPGLELSSGTEELGGFVFAGGIVSGLIFYSVWSVGMGLQQERNLGTLEPAWLTPTSRDTLLLGRALGTLVVFAAVQALLLLIGMVFFGATFRDAIWLAVPAVLLGALSMVGLAYAIAAAAFVLREVQQWADIGGFLFVYASGVAFPITVLPPALQVVSLTLPTTYAMDILRHHALGGRLVGDLVLEHVALIALTLFLLPVGRWAFYRAERYVRVNGTIAQH